MQPQIWAKSQAQKAGSGVSLHQDLAQPPTTDRREVTRPSLGSWWQARHSHWLMLSAGSFVG